jgi:hypothetical protein
MTDRTEEQPADRAKEQTEKSEWEALADWSMNLLVIAGLEIKRETRSGRDRSLAQHRVREIDYCQQRNSIGSSGGDWNTPNRAQAAQIDRKRIGSWTTWVWGNQLGKNGLRADAGSGRAGDPIGTAPVTRDRHAMRKCAVKRKSIAGHSDRWANGARRRHGKGQQIALKTSWTRTKKIREPSAPGEPN